MNLKKGITGFGHATNDEPAPQMDADFLKQVLYGIEAGNGYRVKSFVPPQSNNNYYRCTIVSIYGGAHIHILLNAHYPYYCGVSPENDWMPLKFVSLPSEVRACLDPELEYLSPEQLNQKATEQNLTALSRTEREQVAYWESATLGEIIFNGYD